MTWKIRGRDVAPDDVAGYASFVYLITHAETGRTYVGKKTLTSRQSRPPLKGKKRRRRRVVESGWREYWSSCDELKADVARLGEGAFTREVLHLCKTRGEASYLELVEQVKREVLLDPLSYNGFIGGKVHRSHVKNLRRPLEGELTALQK